MSEKLTPERAVRLLRAKAGELEAIVADGAKDAADEREVDRYRRWPTSLLAADIALVASLLADHIERSSQNEQAKRGEGEPGGDEQ